MLMELESSERARTLTDLFPSFRKDSRYFGSAWIIVQPSEERSPICRLCRFHLNSSFLCSFRFYLLYYANQKLRIKRYAERIWLRLHQEVSFLDQLLNNFHHVLVFTPRKSFRNVFYWSMPCANVILPEQFSKYRSSNDFLGCHAGYWLGWLERRISVHTFRVSLSNPTKSCYRKIFGMQNPIGLTSLNLISSSQAKRQLLLKRARRSRWNLADSAKTFCFHYRVVVGIGKRL